MRSPGYTTVIQWLSDIWTDFDHNIINDLTPASIIQRPLLPKIMRYQLLLSPQHQVIRYSQNRPSNNYKIK